VAGAPFAPSTAKYGLSDDLARLCLPTEYKDSTRTLAWVNSICFLFLLIGIVGLKPPKPVQRTLSKPDEPVPVVFTPPEEQPKVTPEVRQEEPAPQETPLETPQVAVVVAAADAPDVAFAVPVKGAVAVAKEARFAAPPPANLNAAPQPTKFNPNATDGGSYPAPTYPGFAQRNRYQGTVTVEILVDASGAVTAANVKKSSSYPMLDDAAVQVVKNRWRFPPGGARHLLWDCTFELK
jgi:protein TonB